MAWDCEKKVGQVLQQSQQELEQKEWSLSYHQLEQASSWKLPMIYVWPILGDLRAQK